MSKKRSKASQKAKRPRRVVVNDPTRPLLHGVELVPTRPFKPLSAAKQRAWDRERAAWQVANRQRVAAADAAHAARLARRPPAMQEQFKLPPDVRRFVERLYEKWRLWHGPDGPFDAPPVPVDAVNELIEAAYMEGCRQGFIEGRVLDLEPKRARSAKANAAKRKKPRTINGAVITLDQRDTAIVAEYDVLRPILGATEAQYRLAQKYELSDKMVRIIVGKARRVTR